VSLGGDNSDGTHSTAAQVYVSATCNPNEPMPIYGTAYQLASGPLHLGFAPSLGDTLDLKITKKAGTYTLSAKDTTSGASLSGSGLCPTCQNTSAEVTAGSPLGFRPANFGHVNFIGIFVVDNHGTGGGLVNAHWTTTRLAQSGAPAAYTVAGPPHTFVGPPPHSGFPDKWVP
jgi:hypothetical protein